MPEPDLPRPLPTSPTGRVPQWVLDERAGRPPVDTSFRSWQPAPPRWRPVRRARRRRVAFASFVVAALVAAGVAVAAVREDGAAARAGAQPDGVSSSSYRFVHTDPASGAPIGYDPCTPIEVAVRPDGAPPDADAMAAEALATVEAATGLTFVLVGTTDRPPWRKEAVVGPSPDGSWGPVLLAWSDPGEAPDLAGDVAGYAGSVPTPGVVGRSYLRTGEVVMDGPGAHEILRRPDGRAQVVAILTHEVGHLVGLDHVDDASQLMHAENTGTITRFGAGDLAGLRALGEIACER